MASVSLFEFELLRMCDMAQRHSNNQEPTIDPYKFDWRKAKGYLSPDPPKGGALALTQGLMGKGRRTGQARFQ